MYNARRRSQRSNIVNCVLIINKAGEKRRQAAAAAAGSDRSGRSSSSFRCLGLVLSIHSMPYLAVSVSCCRKLCHWMGPETYVAVLYKDDIRAQPGIQRRKYRELRGSLPARPKSTTDSRTETHIWYLGLGNRLQRVTGTEPKTHDKAGSPLGIFGNTDHASQPYPPMVGSSGGLSSPIRRPKPWQGCRTAANWRSGKKDMST